MGVRMKSRYPGYPNISPLYLQCFHSWKVSSVHEVVEVNHLNIIYFPYVGAYGGAPPPPTHTHTHTNMIQSFHSLFDE